MKDVCHDLKVENMLFDKVVLVKSDDWSTDGVEVRVVNGVFVPLSSVRRLHTDLTARTHSYSRMSNKAHKMIRLLKVKFALFQNTTPPNKLYCHFPINYAGR